jgi:ParB-like chromosome segregation protein Spo0J
MLVVQYWAIDRLIPYARNPRKNDAAIDRMCSSIREFGLTIPCLVRSDGEVIDGHLRLKAARKLGITEIPVITCDEWSEAQVKAFRLLVNRSVSWAAWDEELLALELQEIQQSDFDLSLTGFEDDEIQRLLADQESLTGLTDEDAAPALPDQPVTQIGDVWILGSHRLRCGDATSQSDVTELMAAETADMVFTDPPYNVDYEGYTKDRLKIEGDRMSPEQFNQFLATAFRNLRSIVKPGASMYVCHASSFQREVQTALEGASFDVRRQIIWAKNTFAWGFGCYKFQHEPIFYSHVAGESDAW